LGGALAMSSTAIASKMLAERLEIATPHGRDIIGILLFQDLAVVAFLIVLPSLSKSGGELAGELVWAGVKAVVALALILFVGQRPMRFWFHVVARQRSSELFMLNVLLVTLGLAALTELAGLSLALGAFLAGMLIAETEYRYQVEEDIKPFRDVLLGLFFVTVGMALDLSVVAAHWSWVLLLLVVPVLVKLLLIVALSRAFGAPLATSLRTGFYLAQAGEFALGHAGTHAAERDRDTAGFAGRIGSHGAVDADRAARNPLRRADRAPLDGQRLAGPRRAAHQHCREIDGPAGPRSHLRLRAQRPEPGAPSREGGHRLHRARRRSGAGA
jgi:Kef-type K+ transport system membrane component KefB